MTESSDDGFAEPPTTGRTRSRRGLWLASAALVVAAVGTGVAVQSDSGSTDAGSSVAVGDVGAFQLPADAIPFPVAKSASVPDTIPAFATSNDPTLVSVRDAASGQFLVVTGGTDALDAFIPEAALKPDARTGTTYGSKGEWTYIARRNAKTQQNDWIVMTKLPATPATAAAASQIADNPKASKLVAQGDVSAITEAAPAKVFTYGSAKGDMIMVETFATERLDPIFDYLAPIATPVKVGDRAGYAIDAGSSSVALMLDGGDQGLIVMLTSSNLGVKSLVTAAESLEYKS